VIRSLVRSALEAGTTCLVQNAVAGREAPEGAPRRRRVWLWVLAAPALLVVALVAVAWALPWVAAVVLGHPMVWVPPIVWGAWRLERRMAGGALTFSRYARELRRSVQAHRRGALVATGAGAAAGTLLGFVAGGAAMAVEAAAALALLVPLAAVLLLWRQP
jgi:hypothetical protein